MVSRFLNDHQNLSILSCTWCPGVRGNQQIFMKEKALFKIVSNIFTTVLAPSEHMGDSYFLSQAKSNCFSNSCKIQLFYDNICVPETRFFNYLIMLRSCRNIAFSLLNRWGISIFGDDIFCLRNNRLRSDSRVKIVAWVLDC